MTPRESLREHLANAKQLVDLELEFRTPLEMPDSTWATLVRIQARLEAALDRIDQPCVVPLPLARVPRFPGSAA